MKQLLKNAHRIQRKPVFLVSLETGKVGSAAEIVSGRRARADLSWDSVSGTFYKKLIILTASLH